MAKKKSRPLIVTLPPERDAFMMALLRCARGRAPVDGVPLLTAA